MMAKESLAVKYRPKTFDDMTEQGVIKSILANQLRTKTFQHGYLFTGPAGTGKTTSARIFADQINEGKGNPIEVDAASNSGVENIRQIISDAKRKPLDAEYKIFIVDECHSLSNGAWQALLKTLEEPPKFTIFIFCTTDPQKIPATILSRVQRYSFQKISNDGIVKRLATILTRENKQNDTKCIEFSKEALEYIAKISNGGMRDSITLMDKCLALSNKLTLDAVLETIGGNGYEVFIQLLANLEAKEPDEAIRIIEDVHNSGKDLKQFVKDFSKFILEVEKYKLYQSFEYSSIPATYTDMLNHLVDDDSIFDVMDLIVSLRSQIKWESDPKTLIELSIILFCR